MNKSDKILLILDIDETLIHASPDKLDKEPDFMVLEYFVYKRPFLNEFLDMVKKDFLVAVWSSATEDYVHEIVKNIFPFDYPLEFIWGRKRCTARLHPQIDEFGYYSGNYFAHYNYIKPLKKVKKMGFTLEKILIIDDTPHKSKQNYGNAIYPKEFQAEAEDDELIKLATYLATLKEVSNVRTIEKRDWNRNY